VVLALGVDRQPDRGRALLARLAGGLGQLELHRVADHRHRDDEDDQQHQHHVDQRDHVDLAQDLVLAVGVEFTEGHSVLLSPCGSP
jgi:hypothetical protein